METKPIRTKMWPTLEAEDSEVKEMGKPDWEVEEGCNHNIAAMDGTISDI